MAIKKTLVPQPSLERWVDEANPTTFGYLRDDRLIVEYGPEGQRGFINVPLTQAEAVGALLLSMNSALDSTP